MNARRIAPQNWRHRHRDALDTLDKLIIELKVEGMYRRGEDPGRGPADLTSPEWIARLEAAVKDIEQCREPNVYY